MNYLPSRKLVILFLAIFAAGGMVFVASRRGKQPIAKDTIKAQVVSPTSDRDTDSDGLKDWEEVIAGTDPQNPDTDGNGILDNVDHTSTLAFQKEILDQDGALPTPTAELERILSQYMSDRVTETGTLTPDDFSETVQNAITNQTIETTEKILAQQNPYTKDQIRINAAISPKAYFNTIGRLGEKYFPLQKKLGEGLDARQVFKELLEKKHADGTSMSAEERIEILRHIAGFRSKYAGFASELKGVPVPPELSDFHLLFINFMANTSLAIHHISLLDADPILGSIGMEHYVVQMQEGIELILQARDLTRQYNVTFSDQDSRYAKHYFGNQAQ